LAALQHLRQPFDFLEGAGFGDGVADLLDVGGVGLNLRLVGVLAGVGDAEFCLLLDLLLDFLALGALKERGCLLSLLLLDFLEVQETEMGKSGRKGKISDCLEKRS
jgi:hypothetical protein